MIDLRPNCVAQFKMNDNAYSPWVAGLNGVPTERVKNGALENDLWWTWGLGWSWVDGHAKWQPGVGYGIWSQDVGSASGEKWAVFFEVLGGPGAIDLDVKLGGTIIGTVTVKNKKYVFTGTVGDSNSLLEFVPISGIGAKIDNVSAICLDDFPLTGIFYEGIYGGWTSDHSVPGKVNTALHFDGNNRIEVFDEGALEFPSDTQDFSIAIRFKRERQGVSEKLLDKRDSYSDGWFLYFYTNDLLYFRINGTVAAYSDVINDTDWHLALVNVDRDEKARIYVDNALSGWAGDVGEAVMNISNILIVGRKCYSATDYFQSDIDVISFFNKALSQAEMDMLWHGGKGTERLISLHHHIYRGQDGIIDYSSPAAEMALDDLQVTVPDQELPANTIWHYIRHQIDDECGLESDDSPACIVVIDSNGDMIGSTPNPPISLTIERLSNGRFRLRWRYTKLSEEVTPTGFKIYMDSGSGFNFSSPDATIAYGIGGINNEFSWTSGTLTHGQIYRFCVRSYRTGEGESQNTDYVATDADSKGPAAITGLQASYEEI